MFIFQRNINIIKTKKNIFYFGKGYVSPSRVENQGYVVLCIRLFLRLIFLFVTFL